MIKERVLANLEIESRSGGKESCSLEYFLGDSVEMSISCKPFGIWSVSAGDLFDALNLIRLELEKHGYVVLCNGARKDTYPSPMGRSMGKAKKVYVFKAGMQTTMKDLVYLLDPATIDQVTTVSEQRQNYENWIKSLQS